MERYSTATVTWGESGITAFSTSKLLNTNAVTYNSDDSVTIMACAWVDNSSASGYPTLNFGVEAK
ncbi:MAG: hypothetical protein SNG14_07470 [Rikenellaceae bacterium]